jgi:pyruvate/2-oxoacid:ferredoxin oxidoreductase beta subunit
MRRPASSTLSLNAAGAVSPSEPSRYRTPPGIRVTTTALQAIAYGNVYVARVAIGSDAQQTLGAFRDAEAYDGPSLVIAYNHCIAHGIEMRKGSISSTAPWPSGTGR